MELVSFDKLDLFDDESEDDGSGSVSPGMCTFPFFSDEYVASIGKSVGRARGVGSGVFVPIGIKSIGEVFPLVMFATKGVNSKVVAQNLDFPSYFQNKVWNYSFALTSSRSF